MPGAGRLAVDFGTSNTVVALWDDARHDAFPLNIPEFCRWVRQGEDHSPLIPSLIHYASPERRWIGAQVLAHNLYRANSTFRWMKRYITNRSPIRLQAGGTVIGYPQAGKDFLSAVLVFAGQLVNVGDEEVAFTVPVEAFEHYENWLAGVAEESGMPRFRLIDEPSAAALGYGARLQPGQAYLIFDFGGGTLDVSVVLVESEEHPGMVRRCRVLGKAGANLGGSTIDGWLYQETLRRLGKDDADETIRPISAALLVACEEAKEQLTYQEHATLQVTHPHNGTRLEVEFTQDQLEDILDEHEAFSTIDRTIRRALNGALERGYREEDLQAVLMVGGSSQIPSVQRSVRRIFGRERIRLDRPLDAIARGASAFVAGVDFYDHLQHDYAIRFLNRDKGAYDFRTLVQRGSPYPTPEPVARLTIKGSYDGQTHLGIAIFEIGQGQRREPESLVELVFDPTGAARVTHINPAEQQERSLFWMNEGSPTFLTADPPAAAGEPRFDVAFAIDANKRLTITARDLKTGRVVFQDYPVVRLV